MDVIRSSSSWYIKDDSPYYNTIVIDEEPVLEDWFQEFLEMHIKVCQRQLTDWLTFDLLTDRLIESMISLLSQSNTNT